MRMILFVIVAIVFLCCNKYKDLKSVNEAGDLYLRGRVMIENDISGNGLLKPAANASIRIGITSDSGNYIYASESDAEGYFTFTGLSKGKQYFINVNKAVTEQGEYLQFLGDSSIILQASSNDLLIPLKLSTKQNLVVYTVTDETGQGIINDCHAYFFESATVAFYDSTGTNSLFDRTTNLQGNAIKTELTRGQTYYVIFRRKINDSTFLKAIDTLNYTTGTLYRDSIRVRL